ncbi:hypothetical protein HELRODRAFT_170207 [Helobdella robusta]|uniref:Uncharacterized protein n=1 Tax=Helobdella robusta TaxID=6412 RepID=T1F2S6_HELRO|nr:hypothetical protein HELRODRAFT_170207 [Helobdella robusta]ESO07675.1 hypothetical protein HELRODRAFT_170207 [Helobdella robusta]
MCTPRPLECNSSSSNNSHKNSSNIAFPEHYAESYTSPNNCDMSNVDLILGNVKSEFKQEFNINADYFDDDITNNTFNDNNIGFNGIYNNYTFKDQTDLSFLELNTEGINTLNTNLADKTNTGYNACYSSTNLDCNEFDRNKNNERSDGSNCNSHTNANASVKTENDVDVWWSSIINIIDKNKFQKDNTSNANFSCKEEKQITDAVNRKICENNAVKTNNTFLNVPHCMSDFEYDVDEGYVDYSSASSSGVLSPDLDFGKILTFSCNNNNKNINKINNVNNSVAFQINNNHCTNLNVNSQNSSNTSKLNLTAESYKGCQNKFSDIFVYDDVIDVKPDFGQSESSSSSNNNEISQNSITNTTDSNKLFPSLFIIEPFGHEGSNSNTLNKCLTTASMAASTSSTVINSSQETTQQSEFSERHQITLSCSSLNDFDDCGLFSLPSSPELTNYLSTNQPSLSFSNWPQYNISNDQTQKYFESSNFSPSINFDLETGCCSNFNEYDNNMSEINDYLEDFEDQSFNCDVKIEKDLYQNNIFDYKRVQNDDKSWFNSIDSDTKMDMTNVNAANNSIKRRVWSASCLMLNRSSPFAAADTQNVLADKTSSISSPAQATTNNVKTAENKNESSSIRNANSFQKTKTSTCSSKEDHVYAAKLPTAVKSKKRCFPKTFEQASSIQYKQPNFNSNSNIAALSSIKHKTQANDSNNFNNAFKKDQTHSQSTSSVLEIFLTYNKTLDPNKGSSIVLAEELKRLEKLSTVKHDRLLEKLLTSDVAKWQP